MSVTDFALKFGYVHSFGRRDMFEQFKENLKSTSETSVNAREELSSALQRFKNLPRSKQGMWISIVGAIFVVALASYLSIAWYYQYVLVLGIVAFPSSIWVENANSKADRVDGLLRGCIWTGVITVVFQFAGGHYFRSLMAGVACFLVAPWLGKKWINRSDG